MSLLSIVKTVMDSNGWQQPVTAVSSSNDQNMRQSFALANKALTNVSYKNDWPSLVREYTFTTVADQIEYPLPLDFHHLIAPSAMNESQYYALRGSLTPIQWYRKVINGSVDWGDSFRIDRFGKTFQVAPTPSGGSDLIFMYITINIATDVNGHPITRYTQDTDVAVIDEDLVELDLQWRWRQKKGLDYTAEMAELGSILKSRYAQYLGFGELPIGIQYPRYTPITQPNTGGYYPD
jgi:hypothetical protein